MPHNPQSRQPNTLVYACVSVEVLVFSSRY